MIQLDAYTYVYHNILHTLSNIYPCTDYLCYITEFGGESLSSRAYWASELLDLPFLGMSTDACASTVCPAVPGQKQTYTVHLPLSKKFPAVSDFLILISNCFYLVLFTTLFISCKIICINAVNI